MEIIISARHKSVSTGTKDYINEKLTNMLAHKTLKISSVRVILDLQKDRHKAEIIINAKQLTIEADAETNDLFEAIDTAVEKADIQLKKYVDKKQDHHKKTSMRDTVKALNLDLNKKEDEKMDEEEDISI